MTVAVATHERAPSRWRPSREELLDMLAMARDELADADSAIALACFVAAYLARRGRTPADPFDASAERRVLGAMANGRATLGDVAHLEPADFLGDGHRELYAALLRALRLEATIGVRVRPSARRDPALRAYVAAEVRRRAVGNELVTEGAFAAWASLQALPWPGACPRRDVVRVEELAKWRGGER